MNIQRSVHTLENRWRRARYQPQMLPGLAVRVLRNIARSGGLRPDRLLKWTVPASTDHRRHPVGTDSEALVTLHWGKRLVVDVSCRAAPVTVIHNHPFTGAFAVVEGRALLLEYDFIPGPHVDGSLREGELRLCRARWIGPGDILEVHDRERTIHRACNIDSPLILLNVRSSVLPGQRMNHYDPGGVAYPAEPSDRPALQLLETLHFDHHPGVLRLARELWSRRSMERRPYLLTRYAEIGLPATFCRKLLRNNGTVTFGWHRRFMDSAHRSPGIRELMAGLGASTDSTTRKIIALASLVPDRALQDRLLGFEGRPGRAATWLGNRVLRGSLPESARIDANTTARRILNWRLSGLSVAQCLNELRRLHPDALPNTLRQDLRTTIRTLERAFWTRHLVSSRRDGRV